MSVPRHFGIVRRVFTVFGARAVAALMQAAILVVLARALGPSSFGAFVVGLTAGALAGVVTGMGSAMQALLLDQQAEHRSVGTTLLVARVLTAIVAGAVTFGSCLLLGLPPLVAFVGGLWSWTEVVIELIQALLLGQGRLRAASFTILVRRVGPASALLAAALIGHSMWVWLLGGFVATIASSCAALRGLFARPAAIRPVMRASRHYWTSTILSTLQTADVAVVGVFVPNPALVGHYAAAARATSPLNLLTGSLVSVLTPEWVQIDGARDRFDQFLRARRGLLALATALILCSPVAAWLAPLVLGDEYERSAIFFAGVTVAAGVSAIVQGYSAFLFASREAHRVSRARMISIPGGLILVALAASFAPPLLLAFAPAASQVLQLVAMGRETTGFMNASSSEDLSR